MKKFLNKKIIIICSIVIFITILILCNINFKEDVKDDLIAVNTTTKEVKKEDTFFIDIKGSVKLPGVYEMKQNDRVIDAIKIAGGLTKNANTDNINLSQKLHSEMVIYVYSNTEIKQENNNLSCDTVCKTNIIEVNNCVNNENKNLININTANIDELTTLNGIGASKAQSIIEYRETVGLFKTIEEIKNVSGIQDSTFDRIKDMITV